VSELSLLGPIQGGDVVLKSLLTGLNEPDLDAELREFVAKGKRTG
jgi:hypothetical protein